MPAQARLSAMAGSNGSKHASRQDTAGKDSPNRHSKVSLGPARQPWGARATGASCLARPGCQQLDYFTASPGRAPRTQWPCSAAGPICKAWPTGGCPCLLASHPLWYFFVKGEWHAVLSPLLIITSKQPLKGGRTIFFHTGITVFGSGPHDILLKQA